MKFTSETIAVDTDTGEIINHKHWTFEEKWKVIKKTRKYEIRNTEHGHTIRTWECKRRAEQLKLF